MHDPMTQAFEIKSPIKRPSAFFKDGWREPLVTIWHVDPEKDGSDDSCGWFMRSRHGDKTVLEKIRKDLAFEWDSDHGGWFYKDGRPRLSVSAITLNMFHRAAYTFFGRDWKKTDAFMQRNLWGLLHLAENNVDSLYDSITMRFGPEAKADRVEHFASIVYGWILRAERPWYRHPRWHFWHWKFQIHPLQKFKRWAFSRCSACGGRFAWGECPVSDSWSGTGPLWFRSEKYTRHGDCRNPGACPEAAAPSVPCSEEGGR